MGMRLIKLGPQFHEWCMLVGSKKNVGVCVKENIGWHKKKKLVISLKVSTLRFLIEKCFQEIFLSLQEISSCPMEPVIHASSEHLEYYTIAFLTTW